MSHECDTKLHHTRQPHALPCRTQRVCIAGRGDMTTGLLLEPEPSPEVPGPLGALRRQLKQLQAPQSDREGFGRSDSTGPNTLKLLQPTGTNTHLLGGAARPAQHRISGVATFTMQICSSVLRCASCGDKLMHNICTPTTPAAIQRQACFLDCSLHTS